MKGALFYILSSFWAGAVHAATPGHGKTIAAAYIVGARGKPIDAVILGVFVTLSHTSGIVVVGALASIGSAWFVPQRTEAWLALAMGVLVIGLGASMLWTQRQLFPFAFGGAWSARLYPDALAVPANVMAEALAVPGGAQAPPLQKQDHPHWHEPVGAPYDAANDHAHEHADGHVHVHEVGHGHVHGDGDGHDHGHVHEHGHDHSHDHLHGHGHTHAHSHSHDHDHDHPHSVQTGWHSHGWGTYHAHRLDLVTDNRPKLAVLLALSIAGGLLPDPAALAILLAALSSGRVILGIGTVLVFSLGFASALVVVGAIAAHIGRRIERWLDSVWAMRVQIATSALILGMGVFLTAKAAIQLAPSL